MTAPVFWFIKLIAVIVTGSAAIVFLSLEDVGAKGVLAAAIYSLFGMGLFFKDGFSRRQFARRDFYGFNMVMRYFGLCLAGLAALVAAGWMAVWLAQRLI